MKRNALVIGATGLLGYGITHELNKRGWTVRAIGKENLISSDVFPAEVEYICGDFYDETFLSHVLKDIDTLVCTEIYAAVCRLQHRCDNIITKAVSSGKPFGDSHAP